MPPTRKRRLIPMTRRKVPYTIRKANKKNCFRVINRKTRKVFSKCTSKEMAIRQDKLLRGLLYNPQFRNKLH